ncbi:MAG: hypothetical protein JKY61_02220 [Planctomycetes bacterium]|nr:hypothetical protein [Planctomycetota bacterium]
MKLNSILTALQSLIVVSAIIALGGLSAWAGGGLDELSSNGDSVGTLPSTHGGNAIVNGQDTGNEDVGSDQARHGASFYLTLPERSLNQAVQGATGTGHVVIFSIGSGLVRAEFHGDVSLILDEAVLRSLNVEMGLVSSGQAPVLIGMELDSIPARPVVVAGGIASALPILALMNGGKVGTQNLLVQSYQAPYVPSVVGISRGAGILIVTQGSF